jgi:HTH-type transcriptional regulator/antitoxin HigA
MDIHPIRNDADHAKAIRLIERYWDAPEGSAEANALDVLSVLVDDYENTRWPIETLDPIETIKAHMLATERTQSDLAAVIGSRPRASEVIARKRALTIGMIRSLSEEWGLPATLLIAPYNLVKTQPPKQVASAKKGRRRKRAAG